jgi:glucose-1-phosphatase
MVSLLNKIKNIKVVKISHPKNIDKSEVKNIIFDWGGVITNLDFEIPNKMFAELGIINFNKQFSKYNQSHLLKDLEVGKILPKKAFSILKMEMLSGITNEQIIEAWMSVLRDTPIERVNVLLNLKEKYRTFLLSNTNKIHADNFNENLKEKHGYNHFDLFEKVYYSHELKVRKPGKEIFKHAIKDSKLVPSETLFIDDTEPNIDTADALGFISFHLKPHHDIADLFKEW